MAWWSHRPVSCVVESSPQGPLKVGMRALSQRPFHAECGFAKVRGIRPLSRPLQPVGGDSLASLAVFHSQGSSGEGILAPRIRTLTGEESGLICQFHHILQSSLSISTCQQSNRMDSFLHWGSSPEPQIPGESMRSNLPSSPREGMMLALV